MDSFKKYPNSDNIDYIPAPNMLMEQRPVIRNEDDMVLGMAYVKRQRWGEVYDDDTALSKGTLFPRLDYPWKGDGGGSAV